MLFVEMSTYLQHRSITAFMRRLVGKYRKISKPGTGKKIRQHREEKTLTKEIVRLLIIGERKKKTTVTLKQDEIKKYFPPEYDEQKIRTVICQLLEEWSNQNH